MSKYIGKRVFYFCKQCNKTFTLNKDSVEDYHNVFCSMKCYREFCNNELEETLTPPPVPSEEEIESKINAELVWLGQSILRMYKENPKRKGSDYLQPTNEALKALASLLTHHTSVQVKEAYQKGYWNREADDKDAKEWEEATEAHRTEEGYCCACDYDMVVMEEKIAEQVKEERENLLSWIKKESVKSARAKVLGYDFVSRLEKKLEREIATAQAAEGEGECANN